MSALGLEFAFVPTLDVASLNVILNTLKKSMGEAGKNIKLVDEKAFEKDMAAIRKEFDDTFKGAGDGLGPLNDGIDGVDDKLKKAQKGASLFGAAFNFNQSVEAVQRVSDAMNQITEASIQYESSLAAVGAITGFSGDKLDVLGQKARQLAIQFGGSATDQLTSFQGVLSKLGPQIGEDAEALALFGRNINILSAASGDDATTSMNAITDAMLQMGLASGTAMEQAQASTGVINALAAGAQVGAAEIPQVAQALVVAGVAAKGANMDLVGVNAAIQVMATGGKTGAEAGTALRNVLGLLQKASGPAEQAMAKLGTSSKELGELLTTQGLDTALVKLRDGLNGLGTDAERNATMMEIFGTENAAAAGILIQNLDKYKEFSDGIQAGMGGVGSAFEQANQRMDTAEGMISRGKAAINDMLISLGNGLGKTFTTVASVSASVAPMVMTFTQLGSVLPLQKMGQFALMMLGQFVPSLVVGDVATKSLALNTNALSLSNIKGIVIEAAHSAAIMAKSGAVGVATAAQWLWNIALNANPIGLVLAGTVALAAGVMALASILHKSAEEREADLRKENAAIDTQMKNIKSNQERINSNKSLVASYEELGTKSQRTAEEEAKYRDIQIQLAKAYPGVINASASFAQNLEALKKKSAEGGEALKKYQEEMKQLESKKIEVNIAIKQAKNEQIFQDMQDQFSSWSGAEQAAKVTMNKYVAAMEKAQTEADLAKVGNDAKVAIFSDPQFSTLSAEEKDKLVKLTDSYTKNLSDSMKLNQAKAGVEIKNAVDASFAQGTEVSPATLQKIAASTKRPIEEIEKMYAEAKQKAANAKVDEAIKQSFEIKGKMNGAEQAQSLVSEYEKAVARINELKNKRDNGGGLTSAEAKEFDTLGKKAEETANKIGALAPQSKTNFRTVVDSAGNIKEVFDINTQKVNEFADAQKNAYSNNSAQTSYNNALNKQSEIIDQQKTKLGDLKTQIDSTNDPNKKQQLIAKYNEENAAINKNKEDLIESLVKGKEAGLNIEGAIDRVAKSLGVSNDEARKMVLAKALKDAAASGNLTKEKIQEIATKYGSTAEKANALLAEQKKNTREAQDTAAAVKTISDEYEETINTLKGKQKATMDRIVALRAKEQKEGLTDFEKTELKKLEKWAEYGQKQIATAAGIRKKVEDQYGEQQEKKEKKEKQSNDNVIKLKNEVAELSKSLSAQEIEDEKEKARIEKKNALDNNVAKAQEDLDIFKKKIKDKKKLSADEEKEQELRETVLNLTKKKSARELLEYDKGIAKKSLEEKQKAQETEDKKLIEGKKRQLEQLERASGSATSSDAYISNLKAQEALKREIIISEGHKQVAEVINNNDEYKKALDAQLNANAYLDAKKLQITELTNANANSGIIEEAQKEYNELEEKAKKTFENVKAIKDSILNSKEVQDITVRINAEADDKDADYEDKIAKAKIDTIQNSLLRERELKVFEAKKTLAAELQMAKDNEGMIADAHAKYNAAKFEADQEYLSKSLELNDIFRNAMQQMATGIAKSFIDEAVDPVEKAIQSLRKKIDEATNPKSDTSKKEQYDKDLADFKTAADAKVLSSEDMYSKLAALSQASMDAEKAKTEKHLAELKKMQLAAAKGIQMASQGVSNISTAYLNKAHTQLQENMNSLEKSGMNSSENLGTVFNQTSEDYKNFALSAVGTGVASMGAMLAAGEEFGKAFRLGVLANLLETAEKAILIHIPEIYSMFFGWMGPWGYVAATAAIATVYASLEVAKSAIGAYKDGVTDLQGPGTETSDSIPAKLSKHESVLTAKATKAEGNAELFRWLNKTGKSWTEYPQDMPGIMFASQHFPEPFPDSAPFFDLLKRMNAEYPTFTNELTAQIGGADTVYQFRHSLNSLDEMYEELPTTIIAKSTIEAMRGLKEYYEAKDEEIVLGKMDDIHEDIQQLVSLNHKLIKQNQELLDRLPRVVSSKHYQHVDVEIKTDANELIKKVDYERRKGMRR